MVRLSGRTAAAPSALNGARHDQLGGVRGEGARRRGEREQRQAEGEDPPAPEPITECCSGDDPGGERDAVGVDGPLQRGQIGVQVALHLRQRGEHAPESRMTMKYAVEVRTSTQPRCGLVRVFVTATPHCAPDRLSRLVLSVV